MFPRPVEQKSSLPKQEMSSNTREALFKSAVAEIVKTGKSPEYLARFVVAFEDLGQTSNDDDKNIKTTEITDIIRKGFC